MKTSTYYLSIAALLTHELDAVRHAEWGLLYVLRDLNPASAYSTFVVLHFPLIYLMLWLSHSDNRRIRDGFRATLSLFVVMHALIHFRLVDAAGYTFSGWLSEGLIFGSAFFGILYLYLAFRSSRDVRAVE